MFYSYTWSEHKNMIDRFSIHQINASSFYYYLSKLCCRKEAMGYAKVIHKKEKKELRKIDKCPRYLKQ
jgi:ferritin